LEVNYSFRHQELPALPFPQDNQKVEKQEHGYCNGKIHCRSEVRRLYDAAVEKIRNSHPSGRSGEIHFLILHFLSISL
jgi:hypothetical protein